LSNQTKQAIEAVDSIFNARSVAVVGASQDPGKMGYMTLNSIIQGGYEGDIYPINPKADHILGLHAYPSISHVPAPIDLIVIVIPAPYVATVLREAVEKGVSAAVVISGGFREAGRPDLEEELHSISQKSSLRICGPNVQGINYVPNKLCAMFWPLLTAPGPIAIIGQSGTVTASLAEWAEFEGLGISGAVNLGNQVDLCESDFLEFFAEDEKTRAIALYLEAPKEGKRFQETLQRVARKKPVAVLKSGRTAGGQKATASHTGSLAGMDEVFSGACRQLGVFRADDLEHIFDSVKAIATMPEPQGNRLLVLTTSGGSAALGIDEAEKRGLSIPALPAELVERLKKTQSIPAFASFSNPLDFAGVNIENFREAIPILHQFGVADIYLLIFGDPVPGGAEAVEQLAAEVRAPLVVSYLGGGALERSDSVKMQAAGIPVFSTPDRAARGIAAAVWNACSRKGKGDTPAKLY
jgi:acyl-CoA synthetase (NDP forming)